MHSEVQRTVRMLSTAVLAVASLSWPADRQRVSYGMPSTQENSDQGSLRADIECCLQLCWQGSSVAQIAD